MDVTRFDQIESLDKAKRQALVRFFFLFSVIEMRS